MFKAWHKQTMQEYFGFMIWDKFPYPRNEEFVCCPIDNKKVIPVRAQTRTINGKKRNILSFFRLDDGVGGCSTPQSDEHIHAKMLVATLIEFSHLPLLIGNSVIPYNSLKIRKKEKISEYWEQKRENRIADVLFEFEEFNNILGQGLVFEIQLSSISNFDKVQRENDWVLHGYSLAWLTPEDFDDNGLINDYIKIDNVWCLKQPKILYELKEENLTIWNNLKTDFNVLQQELKEKYDYFSLELKQDFKELQNQTTKTCRTCRHGNPEKKKVGNVWVDSGSGLISCWYKRNIGISKRPVPREQFYSCSNWEPKQEYVTIERRN